MARVKKLEAPTTLFAAIEEAQYNVLRTVAFENRCSMADLVREALSRYIKSLKPGHALSALSRGHGRTRGKVGHRRVSVGSLK